MKKEYQIEKMPRPLNPGWRQCKPPGFHICLVLARVCLLATPLTAAADDAQDGGSAHRAEAAFDQTQAQYRSQMDNPVVAWKFARACYDWADFATNKAQRAAVAKEGIAACQQSLVFTNSAAAHYYTAMNMGQLARSEALGALKLVREMEREFQTAASMDPNEDFGGAARGLGLLYRDAPGWPVSVGNRSRARKYLESAVSLAPNFPENVLDLAEGYSKWGDKTAARQELAALDALWPSAQKALTGPDWESSWYDWSTRRDALRAKLEQ